LFVILNPVSLKYAHQHKKVEWLEKKWAVLGNKTCKICSEIGLVWKRV